MEGDANTRLFQTSTLNRIRKNRIPALHYEVGDLIQDQKGTNDAIYQFYSKLYTTDHLTTPIGWQSSIYTTHTLFLSEHTNLNTPLRVSEIKSVMSSFKPTKVPGPYGLHPMFYQKY